MSKELGDFLSQHADEFEELLNGKLKCKLTGHEMPASVDAVRKHIGSNKAYKYAKIGLQLKQFEPQIIQSTEYKEKVLCTLTGALVNRNEEAVWKHLLGKKFQNALTKIEQERKMAKKRSESAEKIAKDLAEIEIDHQPKDTPAIDDTTDRELEQEALQPVLKSTNKKKKGEKKAKAAKVKKQESKNSGKLNGTTLDHPGEEDSVEEGFWIPEPGMRWDGDDEGPRWSPEDSDEKETTVANLRPVEDEAAAGQKVAKKLRSKKKPPETVGSKKSPKKVTSSTKPAAVDPQYLETEASFEDEVLKQIQTESVNGHGKAADSEEEESSDEDFFGRKPKRVASSSVGARVNVSQKKKKKKEEIN